VTFDRARHLRGLVADLPLESLVLETDAPDIPLAGADPKRNQSSNLPNIAQIVADLRGISRDAVAEATSANARRLLHLA